VALVYRIGATEIWTSLAGIRGWYLPLALSLLLADSVIRALNWTRLLRTRSREVRFGPVLHTYLYGGVVGGFIPSSLGSDVTRTGLMARRTSLPLTDLASSILVLNAIGFWTLCAIALVQSLRFLHAGSPIAVLPWTVGASLVGLAGLTAGFAIAPYTRSIPLRGPRPVRLVLTALRSIGSFAKERRALVSVAAMAVVTFLAQFAVVYLLARALQLALPFQLVALLLPIVLLSRLIPLSVGGFGVEQGVFVFVFAAAGIEAPEAFALSLANSATRLVFWVLWAIGYFAASGVAALNQLSARGGVRAAREGSDR
jgi:glycosyltransferase 2 family protein